MKILFTMWLTQSSFFTGMSYTSKSFTQVSAFESPSHMDPYIKPRSATYRDQMTLAASVSMAFAVPSKFFLHWWFSWDKFHEDLSIFRGEKKKYMTKRCHTEAGRNVWQKYWLTLGKVILAVYHSGLPVNRKISARQTEYHRWNNCSGCLCSSIRFSGLENIQNLVGHILLCCHNPSKTKQD